MHACGIFCLFLLFSILNTTRCAQPDAAHHPQQQQQQYSEQQQHFQQQHYRPSHVYMVGPADEETSLAVANTVGGAADADADIGCFNAQAALTFFHRRE